MKNICRITLPLLVLRVAITISCQSKIGIKEVDICIYGGTSAGVIAAYTAQKAGKSVLLIEPWRHLGGMSSGGLGFTDIGNKYVVQGLALDFYRRLGMHYGKLEQWTFEPGVAEAIFNDYVNRAGIDVWFESRVIDVKKEKSTITGIVLENAVKPNVATNRTVHAKVFMDCSYEGDLMAKAGVSYVVGREANSQYDETYNGVELLNRHQFPDGIDPYVVKGDPSSGLLYGISKDSVLPNGTGDKKVQAYNFRITLTNKPGNRLPIALPDNYDASRYELLLRLKEKYPWKSHTDVFIWSAMPNGKTDINNFGGFSTDVIGENWDYPEASYEERAKIWKFHEDYTKGLLYFVGHDERIPEFVRAQMRQWGFPKDEYADNDHWTHQLYVRECRRMVGETVMTQHHCQGNIVAPDTIGWAAYTMDSHNCDRHVINGMVKNEGNVEVGGFGPYPIAYGAITPNREEANNLLVPVCLSASHIAYGSIRMEPVFMVLGQSAAIAACSAIDNCGNIVQQVNAAAVWNEFRSNPLADGSQPEIVVDNNDANNVAIHGEWKTVADGWKAYGSDFYTISSENKGIVKYTPQIVKKTNYNVYIYCPKVGNASACTSVVVFDGACQREITIKAADVVVEGQASGEWIHLGSFHLPAGTSSYVEISNTNATGVIVADAVLFIPEKTNKHR
jgi:hypothetical protein